VQGREDGESMKTCGAFIPLSGPFADNRNRFSVPLTCLLTQASGDQSGVPEEVRGLAENSTRLRPASFAR
jgi:hypothetical protein